VGVNVVAYVTGREILNKLDQREKALVSATPDRIERDLLQISKIRYQGDWDAAPQALKTCLSRCGKTAGMAVSTKHRDLTLLDPNLFRYAVMYMHGRARIRPQPKRTGQAPRIHQKRGRAPSPTPAAGSRRSTAVSGG